MLCIKNKYSTKRPLYIGNQYPLRLNVVLGISNESQDIFPLIDDAIEIVEHGADCIQDVSICGKINEFKKRLVSEVAAPCGSVLAYEFAYNVDKYKLSKLMDIRDLLLDLVTKDAEMGMDFLTLHSSLSLKLLSMQFDNRIIYMGSRGSSLLYKMMNRLNIDNPLHLYYEDIIEVMKKYNMAVSLGSAFRSCSILDYSYKSMNEELAIQSELSTIAHAQDLPVLLEGISHIPISKLLEYVTLVNEKCPGVEVTALGPSPTDVGVGIDHIAGAIAAERAAESGFTLLTIVTGKEHYSLPSREDVLEALNAYKLAVYISNLHKGYLPIMDKRVSIARNNLEWDKVRKYSLIESAMPTGNLNGSSCSICAEHCPLFIRKEFKLQENTLTSKEYNIASIRPMLNIYPIKLQNLFWNVLEKFSCNKDIERVITFGSLVTGDFWINQDDSTVNLCSDFEFTILIKKFDSGTLHQILTIVKSINDKYAKFYSGWHVNIKVTTENRLLKRIQDNKIFCSTLAHSGVVIIGNPIIPVKMEKSAIDVVTDINKIEQYMLNIIYEYIIQLNIKLVNSNMDVEQYLTVLTARVVLKLANVFVIMQKKRMPSNWSEVFSVDVPQGLKKRIDNVFNIIRTRFPQSSYDSKTVLGNINCVLEELEKTYGFVLLDKVTLLDMSVNELLCFIAKEHEIIAVSKNNSVQHSEAARVILRGKKENYNYYKRVYGMEV